MKIAITGHSRGIGKALYEELSTNHEVEGFSRSNGYDITTQQTLIARTVKKYDVFVNNAWQGYAQLELLTAMFNTWKTDETKWSDL